MCTSYVWNRRRDLQRKGVGRGRPSPSPEGGLSNWLGLSRSLHAPPKHRYGPVCPGLEPQHEHTQHLLSALCVDPLLSANAPLPTTGSRAGHHLSLPSSRQTRPRSSGPTRTSTYCQLWQETRPPPSSRTHYTYPKVPALGRGRPLPSHPRSPRASCAARGTLPSAHRLRPAQRAHSNPPRSVWSPFLSWLIPVGLGAPPGRTDLRTLWRPPSWRTLRTEPSSLTGWLRYRLPLSRGLIWIRCRVQEQPNPELRSALQGRRGAGARERAGKGRG